MTLTKKVAVLGAFAVGKTSLVQRFVTGIFSDRYLTTIGVKIDRRDVAVDGRPVSLMVWDLQGEDERHRVRMGHVRGSSGLLLVADGLRSATVTTALQLADEARAVVGDVPCLLLVNKDDRRGDWEVASAQVDAWRQAGHDVRVTSALTGSGVAEAFADLARRMVAP